MIEPAIDRLIEKVGNKYELTTIVYKQAKIIYKENRDNNVAPKIKPISKAVIMVDENKLGVDRG